jgi:AAA domain-containing protein
MLQPPENSEIGAAPFEHEIPYLVAEAIASWRRTIHRSRPENSTTLLERAAVELWRLAKAGNDSHVHQAVVDALQEMADFAGIDPDEAQLIFTAAKDAPADRPRHDRAPTGRRGIERAKSSDERIGHTTDERPAPLIMSSAKFVEGFVPPDYLIDGMLQRGFIYSFTGKTGSGKTAVALLIAASVSLGLPIGSYTVEKGRALYFAGENDIDVRMRWIAMADQMSFDIDAIETDFIPGPFKLSTLSERIKKEVEGRGGVSLVVIDTSAAFFEGDQANDNVQQGTHARRLRGLTKLAGSPCIIVATHPVKNAADDNLIPYGGGAFLNEMDGNLTCKGKDGAAELHWQGKFRGPDFAPATFQLRTVTKPGLVDSKGRLLPTVIAGQLTEADQQQLQTAERLREDKLLIAIATTPGASLASLAKSLGWFMKNGEPYKMMVKRTAESLSKSKLVQFDRGALVPTDKGQKAIDKLCYGSEPTSNSFGTS